MHLLWVFLKQVTFMNSQNAMFQCTTVQYGSSKQVVSILCQYNIIFTWYIHSIVQYGNRFYIPYSCNLFWDKTTIEIQKRRKGKQMTMMFQWCSIHMMILKERTLCSVFCLKRFSTVDRFPVFMIWFEKYQNMCSDNWKENWNSTTSAV